MSPQVTALFFLAALFLQAACGSEPKDDGETSDPLRRARPERTAEKAPNVLLFSIDTLRADHLGAYGYEREVSPRIDAFAEESVRFTHAISQAPSTAPAHMSIFTATTPAVHKVRNMGGRHALRAVDPAIPPLTETFAEHGYLNAGFHGGGNVSKSFGFDRGFDLYSQDLISYNWLDVFRDSGDLDSLRHWIRLAGDRNRPFFLFLHHYVCHAPYISAPQAHLRPLLEGRRAEGLPDGIPDEKRWTVVDELEKIRSSRNKVLLMQKLFGHELKSFWKGVDLSRREHREHIVAMYDAGVRYSDHLFGEVLDLLEEEGVSGETLVVLLSDHGEEFGEHGGREHGRLFVEHLRVPLLIRFPRGSGIEPRVVERPVRTMDVLPTVLDYLDVRIEHPVQGVSFLGTVGEGAGYDPPLVSFGDPLGEVRLLTDAYTYTNESFGGVSSWLFSRSGDPRESDNLSAENEDVVERMESRARELLEKERAFEVELRRWSEQKRERLDPRLLKQLEMLGYLE
ncbi:MAG: sulfatase [Polyangia bacterium]